MFLAALPPMSFLKRSPLPQRSLAFFSSPNFMSYGCTTVYRYTSCDATQKRFQPYSALPAKRRSLKRGKTVKAPVTPGTRLERHNNRQTPRSSLPHTSPIISTTSETHTDFMLARGYVPHSSTWRPRFSPLVEQGLQTVIRWSSNKVCLECRKRITVHQLESFEKSCPVFWRHKTGMGTRRAMCGLEPFATLFSYNDLSTEEKEKYTESNLWESFKTDIERH